MRLKLLLMISLLISICILIFIQCEDSTEPNTLPEVRAISADPNSIFLGDTCMLSCTALDPDGDAITYQWSGDAGTFLSPNSAQTAWVSPATAGSFKLKCTVSDGKDQRWATVNVGVVEIDVPEGVAAYWPFDADFNDYAADNDGTPGEGTSINFDESKIGTGCAEFTGEDGDVTGIITAGSALGMGPDDDFTVTLWINTEDDAASLFGKTYEGNYVEGGKAINFEGIVLFDIWGIDAVEGETEINDGEWHHVAAVKSGMDLTLYVDGEEDATFTAGEWTDDEETVITMGGASEEGDTWPGSYAGLMDDVRFYQKALSAEEIADIAAED